jgi:hypothetical protein
MEETRKPKKALQRFKWRRPDADTLPLQFSIAESVLKEFVLSHDPSAVLTELVQNEYDAEGTQLRVSFGDNSVTITGNGKPVDRPGWNRLSVMMGTGTVAGSDRTIKAKTNGIGSKNFGLRSLFIYGDQIWVRSGGRQTVLDLRKGTLPKPLPERSSRHRPGINIEIPYRTTGKGDMQAFDSDKELQALNRFSEDMTAMLIKLADPDSPRSLQELTVSSKHHQRRMDWKQLINVLASRNKNVKVLHRTITMKDHQKSGPSSKHVHKLEEVEFQKNIRVPEEFEHLDIPDYFRTGRGRIRLALSVRIKQGKIDLSEPGLFYYPLGLIHAHTGIGVSVNAPFQLDNDRTRIIAAENSLWNNWLLERACDFTFELLVTDWVERFGHQAYLALDELVPPSIIKYRELVAESLRTEPCWPTRARVRGHVEFATADEITVPAEEDLDGFFSDKSYLDKRLASVAEIKTMVGEYGAKTFTVNSLIRLRCFGVTASGMHTKLGGKEANHYYAEFPHILKDEELQAQFARALDHHSRKLSKENLIDLNSSPTTLAADNSLQSPSSPLWVVDATIAGVCPVLSGQRLHPSLLTSKTITKLCRKFDVPAWARNTAKKIQDGGAIEEEQEALYGYILSVHGNLGRTTKALLRKLPVLRGHKGEWVPPCQITTRRTGMAKRLEAVLHFPSRDYAGDMDLARAFRFKTRIEAEDILKYAQLIKDRPELAESFEGVLQQLGKVLNRSLVTKLSQVPFLRDSLGGISAPTSIYIRNRLNSICLDDTAPFMQGNRISLYKQLGCRERPKAEDIVEGLRMLSDKPKQPEIIYAALASALRMEKLPPGYYSDEPIIWNGGGYSSPENTLLGLKYRKTFFDAVPCISVASRQMRDIFRSLGVCSDPQKRHWKQLLVWFGQKYQDSGDPVPENERRALRKAYRALEGIPEGLPNETKCLLDRQGNLHDVTDVHDGQLLIDDNPQLASAVVEQGIPIYFADTSEEGTLSFFYSAGVKLLTVVQKRQRVEIGELMDTPVRCNPSAMLKQMHSPEFASALIALKEYELRGALDRTSIDTVGLQIQLSKIEHLSFVKEIKGIYQIGKYSVRASEDFALRDDSLILVKIRSNSELLGVLSQVIATMLVDSIARRRALSDAIYRLLSCHSNRQMENYLNNRGITWRPSSKALEEWEEEEYESEYGSGEDISNVLGDLLSESVGKHERGYKGGETRKPSPEQLPEEKPTTIKREPRSLPPLESIEVITLQPSDTWTPSPPKSGGRGGPSYWTPPGPSDEEWERKVGRHGEKIIYQQELNRVRHMGYAESRVVWVADQDSGADFDILSVDDDGEDIWIEVKSTTGIDGRFRWPKSEFEKAIEKRNRYILWRVYEASSVTPRVKPFRDPVGILLRKGLRLDIGTFNAMVEPMQT